MPRKHGKMVMARLLKILLITVVALVIVVFGGLAIAAKFIDPNDYRGKITELVKKQTGRDLSLGNIELSIFPWLNVQLDDVSFSNAPGFGSQPMARIDNAAVGVQLMPLLLDRKVEVSTVTLNGLDLDLAVDANGVTNWDDLIKASEAEKPADPDADKGKSVDLESIDIAGVALKDANIRYRDAQTGQAYRIEKLNLDTGALQPGKSIDIEASLSAIAEAQKMSGDLTLSATVLADMVAQKASISDLSLAVTTQGDGMNASAKLEGNVAANLGTQLVDVSDLKLDFDTQMADLSAKGTLTGKLKAALAEQQFEVAGLKLDADASGDAIPGGAQELALSGNALYNGSQGTLKFNDGKIRAAGLNVSTSITGQGLNGDNPRLSGPIDVASFSPRDLLKTLGQDDIKTSDASVLSKASLSTRYSGSFNSARFEDLKLSLDDTNVTGAFAVRDFKTQALEFALKADQLNADRYTTADESKPAEKPSKSGSKELNKTEIPVKALEGLNASGTLDVGELKLKGATLKDVRLRVDGPKNAPKVVKLDAKAYGGQISTSSKIAPGGTPSYSLNTSLSTMQMAPMLQNFMGKDFLSGLGTIKLDLNSGGTTVGDARRNLNGDVALNFENGAVKGFNLGQIVRQGQAALRGESFNAGEAKETDFSSIGFAAKIVNGVLKSDQLNAQSPLFRLAGSGEIDLVNETINYLASPTVVGSSKGQGGKGLEELAGLTIPIKLTGSLYSPSYKLDLKSALQQKAGQELKDKVAEKLLGKTGLGDGADGEEATPITQEDLKAKAAEKLNKELGRGLNKLFGGGKKAEPEPEAEAAPAEQ